MYPANFKSCTAYCPDVAPAPYTRSGRVGLGLLLAGPSVGMGSPSWLKKAKKPVVKLSGYVLLERNGVGYLWAWRQPEESVE